MGRDRISQKRIAEILKLSTATVSRSLRNDRSIHPETRSRVLKAATELGYQPPPARDRNLAGDERPVAVAQVLLGYPSQTGRADELILAGISRAAAVRNISIAAHVLQADEVDKFQLSERQPPGMRAGLVDAVLLLHEFPVRLVEELARRFVCVSVVHRYEECDVDCIDIDQRLAMQGVIERLVELGHRRIGFLCSGVDAQWERRRVGGYREGLFGAGIELDPELVLNADGAMADPGQRADAVLALRDRGVTGWVCVSDPVAFELCRELAMRGVKPGHDISITGYDGIEPPNDCPDLGTVRVPFEALGDAAVRRILYRLEDLDALHRDVFVRHQLHLGDTMRAPPQLPS